MVGMTKRDVAPEEIVSKEFGIRPAVPEDVKQLYELEKLCWEECIQATAAQIRRRIERNPDGVFVLIVSGCISGVLYTQTLPKLELVYSNNTEHVEQHHVDGGSCLHLLSISVDPQHGTRRFGDMLIQHCLAKAVTRSSIKRMFGVTRCRSFDGDSLDSLDDYVGRVGPDGFPVDPILAFHRSNGAKVCGLVQGYRPADIRNLGAGVLVEYDLSTSREIPALDKSSVAAPRASAAKDEPGRQRVRQVILEVLASILMVDPSEVESIMPIGWMEAGLDSLGLLQLQGSLEAAFHISIQPDFFFEFPTPQLASCALAARLSGEDDPRLQAAFSLDETRPEGGRVAIVGLGCKFPSADGPDEFWELLSTGRTTLAHVPKERLSWTPDLDGIGGWLPDIAGWDASFFGVSTAAAALMDPQHRFMFEVSWSALEHAGINPESVAGTRTGLYFGVFGEEYRELCTTSPDLVRSPYFGTGTSSSGAAGAVAHALDAKGPAVTINTACSSSLVAVSQACKALSAGECDLAIAGGVNVVLSQHTLSHFRAVGIVSPDGTCRPLDAEGNGTAIGEGAGVVVCKLLSQATADCDRILAIIPSSTVNQDGRTSVLTAPSPDSQRRLLHETLRQAGLDGDEIDYVELHGTGTPLGDPIEVNAVTAVLEEKGRTRPVAFGSAKANLGHCFSAAGIASLIKIVLALQNEAIPPQPSFETLNPKVLRSAMVTVPKQLQKWQAGTLEKRPRAAIVSSFGFIGTNAQVSVLPPDGEDTDSYTAVNNKHSQHILTLSAKSETGLEELVRRHCEMLSQKARVELGDYCFTSNVGRAHFTLRIGLVASTQSELLAALARAKPRTTLSRAAPKALAFAIGINSRRGREYGGWDPYSLTLHLPAQGGVLPRR